MNRQEASLFVRPRVVPYSPVPPNKAMQPDGRFAAPLIAKALDGGGDVRIQDDPDPTHDCGEGQSGARE
jgi:hypothetical protein